MFWKNIVVSVAMSCASLVDSSMMSGIESSLMTYLEASVHGSRPWVKTQ